MRSAKCKWGGKGPIENIEISVRYWQIIEIWFHRWGSKEGEKKTRQGGGKECNINK